MIRTILIAFLLLTSIASVSASIVELDEPCTSATYGGEDVSSLLIDDENYNCLDVVCALVDAGGRPIYVSDGTVDASDSGAERLLGRQSLLLTDANYDLRDISGVCETPTFEEAYCSARNHWKMALSIMRHYTHADGDEGDTEWNSVLFGDKPNEAGVDHEVATLSERNAYRCQDTMPPQLLYNERFNFVTGERTIELTYSDDEEEHRITDESGEETTINLLMDGQSQEGERTDRTYLVECAYAITDSAQSPGASEWNTLSGCGEQQRTYEYDHTIEPESFSETSGLYLHLSARDSVGNAAERAYKLKDYYEALGSGYCPRQNECLVHAGSDGYARSADLETNDFTRYLSSAGDEKPVCVTAGSGVNNIYCSEQGVIERSQALFHYGITQLNAPGAVYCGEASTITRSGHSQNACARGLVSGPSDTCAHTCVLSLDNDPMARVQRSAALYATNNFLKHALDADHPEHLVYTPRAFTENLEYRGSGNTRYLGNPMSADASCELQGHTFTCDVWTQQVYDGAPSQATLKYHNRSGISAVGQTFAPQAATSARIQSGYAELTSGSFGLLTERLNAYLDDISLDGYTAPSYSTTSLKEITRTSAYRTGPGGERVVGLSTRVEGFRYKVSSGSSAEQPLNVVAVLYENFEDGQRTYIDQAKDAITTTSTGPLRTATIPELHGEEESNTYLLFVAAKSKEDAHEMIERLVVRLRLGR